MRKVLVDKDGLVINAIEIEDGADWQPPVDCTLLNEADSSKLDIGFKKINNQIIKPAYTDRTGKTITPEPVAM